MKKTEEEPEPSQTSDAVKDRKRRPMNIFLRIFFGVLLPLAVLIAGGKVVLYMIDTAPKAERRSSSSNQKSRLVEAQPARISTENTSVDAYGTVKPARMIQLQPRVSGEIIEVSDELMPGGVFKTGDVILRIDPTDYKLIVSQRTSEVANAESAFRIEQGNQSIEKREYELLGETIRDEDRDLILRQPQLKAVEAAVDIAKAMLKKAELDLSRTEVRAPFNCMVESYSINLGAQVSTNTNLATLVGTDEYWIELSVPVYDLKWIQIPRAVNDGVGSEVRVYNKAAWGENVYRTGLVIRLAGSLEQKARMARLIVSAKDPLGLTEENAGASMLLINSYVGVEIEGIQVENVIAIPRRLLRDGDHVWILNKEGKLEIRPVTVAYGSRNRVLISSGVTEGELVVTTDLSAPIAGAPLRTEDQEVIPKESKVEAKPSIPAEIPESSGSK